LAYEGKKSIMVRNPFHLVEFSPWPLVGSMGAFFFTVGLASWFHRYGGFCIFFGVFIIIFTMVQWWRDVVREGAFQGFHTGQVSLGLR
jgi:cytochrome c oxidase subunit 3